MVRIWWASLPEYVGNFGHDRELSRTNHLRRFPVPGFRNSTSILASVAEAWNPNHIYSLSDEMWIDVSRQIAEGQIQGSSSSVYRVSSWHISRPSDIRLARPRIYPTSHNMSHASSHLFGSASPNSIPTSEASIKEISDPLRKMSRSLGNGLAAFHQKE